jgi:hypothetical protein
VLAQSFLEDLAKDGLHAGFDKGLELPLMLLASEDVSARKSHVARISSFKAASQVGSLPTMRASMSVLNRSPIIASGHHLPRNT